MTLKLLYGLSAEEDEEDDPPFFSDDEDPVPAVLDVLEEGVINAFARIEEAEEDAVDPSADADVDGRFGSVNVVPPGDVDIA